MLKRKLSILLALIMILGTVNSMTLFAAPAPEVGNKYLQENLKKFPDMFDNVKNQTNPIFSDANNRVIQEQVWIETPLDTDFDGQRDLMRVTIRRQIETLPENGGLVVPVIATLSPYRTTLFTPTFAAFAGRVDNGFEDQGKAATRFWHTRFIDRQQIFGPENDLSYQALRAITDKRVGKGKDAHVARYKDLLADGMLKATSYTEQQAADYPWLPPARTPQGKQLNGTTATVATFSAGAWSAATFIPRGYAFVRVDILGNDYAQGILQYGMYQESLCAAAVVDWLNGRIRGYTDQTGTIEVEAYWATGEVAASGTSFGGTLPIAAAITGVEGLRTIIPGAPVTNAYNYYRENGIPYAPGDGNAGEDITSTTYYCFGRGWNASAPIHPTPAIWDTWWDWEAYLLDGKDSTRGDYSPFWDERNPLSFGYDMRKDVGVIMGHGLNDPNVKFRHTALYNEMLKYYGIEVVKGVYGQSVHALTTNRTGSWVAGDNLIQWTDHYLYGVDNGITEKVPNYIVESNIGTAQWTEYDTWPANTGYKKFYPTGGRVGALSEMPQKSVSTLAFKDTLVPVLTRPTIDYAAMAATLDTAARRQILVNGVNNENGWLKNALIHAGQGLDLDSSQYYRWKNWLVGGLDATTAWNGGGGNQRLDSASAALTSRFNIKKAIDDRLMYNVDIPKDFTISGTVKMTAEVAASKDVGALSAMLVEWGSTVKIVALGSVDVRNPNPEGTTSFDVPALANPDKGGNWHANYLFQSADIVPYGVSAPTAANFNSYTWEMDITEYKFRAGNKLGLIIFGSDPVFTYRPTDATEFSVKIGPDTFLSLPVIGETEKFDGINLTYDGKIVRKGQYVNIDASLVKPLEANVAVLDFKYDTKKFDYANVSVPAGVTVVSADRTDDGVKITVMIPNYEAKDLVTVMLRAKEDAELIRGDNPISVLGELVVKDENGVKYVVQVASDSSIVTDDRDDGEIEPGKKFTMIDLSDIIDMFGFDSSYPEWKTVYRFFDFNYNKIIDIDDIAYVAKFITQE